MDEKFTVDYQLPLHELAPDAKLHGWCIFNCLQDAAGRHADHLGLGLRQLASHHLIWVLSRIRYRMEEFPEYGDVLRITTYPSGYDRLFAYRQFRIDSALTGRHFGVAGSAWLTLNPDNFRPVSPVKYLEGLPHWTGSGDVFFQSETLGKLRPLENAECDTPREHRVSSAEIDYNRHLNNAYYAMLTEDWLGEKTGRLARMHEVQINFNSSTPCGEHLICRGVAAEDGTFYVSGEQQSTGRNAFQASGTFREIPEKA